MKTEYQDKKRQGELNQQLKEGMIPSVTKAIHKELEQILARRKQRREEEKARVKKKAFVETKCHCGNLFMRKNLKGMSATHCPECRAALSKKNVPYAKRKTQLFKCETCLNNVSHENILPHEGKQICGDCYEKILDVFYKADTLERRISERSQIGSSLDQMRQVAIGKGNDEDTFEPKRRYVKNKVSGVKK